MDAVMNAVRREAERVVGRLAGMRLGVVTSYDPSSYAVKVRLQPEGNETGWCPVAVPMVGNGWGIHASPMPGDQVVVGFQEHGSETPIVLGSIYSDADRPPVEGIGGSPAGEVWLVHKSGARIRMTTDGTIEIRQQAGTQAKLNPDGSIDLNGPVLRIGAEGATFRQLLDERFHAWVIGHVHPNVGPPVAPPSLPASATTNLRGA